MDNNFDKLAAEAYNLHVSGKLEEADAAYKKLIEIDNGNIDILNLYAQLKFALKDYDTALKYFKEVYEKTNLDEAVKCGTGKIEESPRAFNCTEKGCGCTLWKDILTRGGGPELTGKLVKLLLEKTELKGSTGTIRLREGNIEFVHNGK